MQRHQLNLVEIFITLSPLHHIAQGKARDNLCQRHGLIQLITFKHFRHPLEQRIDVFHPHLCGFRTAGGLKQPALIVDTADQIAHRADRLPFSQLHNLIQPVGKTLQMLQTAPA